MSDPVVVTLIVVVSALFGFGIACFGFAFQASGDDLDHILAEHDAASERRWSE